MEDNYLGSVGHNHDMRLVEHSRASAPKRSPLGVLTLALAAFAIAMATLQTVLPTLVDVGDSELGLLDVTQLAIVGMSWFTLTAAAIRPSPVRITALTTALVFCAIILAPAIIVAAMYRAWLAVVVALGVPAAIAAAVRSIIACRGSHNRTSPR